MLEASRLIVSGTHGFYGTVLLVGSGTVVDELAAELAGSELELERAPREQAVTLIQLVAPDLLVLAGDCTADAGSTVLTELARAGVTTDLRVLVVTDSVAKSLRSVAFRHVVRVPLGSKVAQCATRIKAVLARLSDGDSDQPLQAIVDEVCGVSAAKPAAEPAAKSPTPRAAIDARAKETGAAAEPAKAAVKAAEPKPVAAKPAVVASKQPAASGGASAAVSSAAKKPAQAEAASRTSPLSAASKPSATLPMAVFNTAALAAQPVKAAAKQPAVSEAAQPVKAAVKQPAASEAAQPAVAAQAQKPESQTAAFARPTAAQTSARAAAQPKPVKAEPKPEAEAQPQAAVRKATMMQWPSGAQPDPVAKREGTLKFNLATASVEPAAPTPQPSAAPKPETARAPVEASPLQGIFEDFESQRPTTPPVDPRAKPIVVAKTAGDDADTQPVDKAALANATSVSPAVDVAMDDFDSGPPAKALEASPVSVSPAVDVAMDDFDTRPPARPVEASAVSVSPAVDVAIDDVDTRRPAKPAQPSPVSVSPAVDVTMDDVDTRRPAKVPQANPPALVAAVEVAKPEPPAINKAAAKQVTVNSVALDDLDAALAEDELRPAGAGFMSGLRGLFAKKQVEAVPPELVPKRRGMRPVLLVPVVLAAVGAGSAWALLQKQGSSSASQGQLLRAVKNSAPAASAEPVGTPSQYAQAVAVAAAREVQPSREAVEPNLPPTAAGDEALPAASDAVPGSAVGEPPAVSMTAAQHAQALVSEGQGLARGGRLGLAEAAYVKALKLVPNYPSAMAALVRLHIQRGDGVEAVRWAVALVKKQPGKGINHTLLGDAWALRDNEPAARSAWSLGARMGDPLARKRLKQ